MTTLEKTKEKISAVKMRLTVVLTALLALLTFAAPVSAGPVINGTILEILNGVAGIMPSFLSLTVAVAPVIITVAVIGFCVMFINKILTLIR